MADDGREVEVPLGVYKTVTVVSTTLAVIGVVAGFVLLDGATARATLPVDRVDAPRALAGLGCMALGALIYAYGTRFRAEGMADSRADESDEGGDAASDDHDHPASADAASERPSSNEEPATGDRKGKR